MRRKAGFLNTHLWVTPFDPSEIYASGPYPNENCGEDGLPLWTRADRRLLDRDIVLWYSIGVTHTALPEQ